MSTGRRSEADFLGELIAEAAAKIVSGGGGIGLAGEFFLVGVATEVVFFFEEEQILAAEEIGGGESGHAAADDDDVDFARGVGLGEGMAIADLVADGEVFAFDGGGRRFGAGVGEKRLIDGTTGGDGASDDEFDEVTTGVRHGNESS